MQQRDEAVHQIEQMRQSIIHKACLLPTDDNLMKLTLDDVHSLQARLQQELSKLTMVNYIKKNFHNSK